MREKTKAELVILPVSTIIYVSYTFAEPLRYDVCFFYLTLIIVQFDIYSVIPRMNYTLIIASFSFLLFSNVTYPFS